MSRLPGCACNACEPSFEVASAYSARLVLTRYGTASEAEAAYDDAARSGQRALLLVNGEVARSSGFAPTVDASEAFAAALADERRAATLPCPPPVGCAPDADEGRVGQRGAA